MKPTGRPFSTDREAGLSLIAVLVLMALLAIAAVVWLQMARNASQAKAAINQFDEASEVEAYLATELQQALPTLVRTAGCAGVTPAAIENRFGGAWGPAFTGNTRAAFSGLAATLPPSSPVRQSLQRCSTRAHTGTLAPGQRDFAFCVSLNPANVATIPVDQGSLRAASPLVAEVQVNFWNFNTDALANCQQFVAGAPGTGLIVRYALVWRKKRQTRDAHAVERSRFGSLYAR